MKPATSSDSASGRSKGGRLVSASAEMKKSTNIGKSGLNTNQPRMSGPCARTMSERLSEPAKSRTVISTKPIETSYETICAAERSEPKKAYFEFDAQPPMMMP